MKTIQKNEDGNVVVELTPQELKVIYFVGVEFTQGAHAPDDNQWPDYLLDGFSRRQVIDLFDKLGK